MVTFGLDDFKTEMHNWTKHHKEISLRVRRTYSNGDVKTVDNKELASLIDKHEDLLRSKVVSFFNDESRQLEHATDHYLPLKNLDYEEANLEYYSVGSSNTEQTTHVRLTFMLEYDRVVLAHSLKSSGSYATSFYDQLNGIDSIEEIIEEILEKELPLVEVGIAKGKDEDYHVILVTPEGETIDVELSKRELLSSLVNVEVYKFDQIIL
ncbi:hypothetical protein MOB78_13340 [Bacillus spizizenii]|nr:hypothetical protein [Bacillus spizizenii]